MASTSSGPNTRSSTSQISTFFIFLFLISYTQAVVLPSLNLTNGINATQGFHATWLSNTTAGHSVRRAGDVNKDGLQDLVIGVPTINEDRNGGAYLIFGTNSTTDREPYPGAFNISVLAKTQSVKVICGKNRSCGTSVSWAGDINGDGVDDVIIGAPGTYGSAYVLYGNSKGYRSAIKAGELTPDQGFEILGTGRYSSVGLGSSVSGAGDMNGDGVDDILVAIENVSEAVVIYGSKVGFSESIDLQKLTSKQGFFIKADPSQELGNSVTGLSDVNADGVADIAISGFLPSNSTKDKKRGATFVIYGCLGGCSDISLASTDQSSSRGFIIEGGSLVHSVNYAGDVNADGVSDIAISTAASQSYLIYGRPGGYSSRIYLETLTSLVGFVVTNATKLSGAGDVNKDGINDLIASNVTEDLTTVIFGKSGGYPTGISMITLNTTTEGFKVTGPQDVDFGSSVGSAGDFNGDGIGDVMIGAPSKVSGKSGIYLIYGIDANSVATPPAHKDIPLTGSQWAVVIVAILLVMFLMVISALKKVFFDPWFDRKMEDRKKRKIKRREDIDEQVAVVVEPYKDVMNCDPEHDLAQFYKPDPPL